MRGGGDFAPFIQLLHIAEIVHVGTETTCGLGQFEIIDGLSMLRSGEP